MTGAVLKSETFTQTAEAKRIEGPDWEADLALAVRRRAG
jgi:hypothetical protein